MKLALVLPKWGWTDGFLNYSPSLALTSACHRQTVKPRSTVARRKGRTLEIRDDGHGRGDLRIGPPRAGTAGAAS
jgi:hypothetical protein